MDREEEEEESMVKKMEEDSRPTHHQERLHPHHRRLEYEDDVSDGSSASVTVATQDQLLKDIQCLIDQEDVARVIKEADANLARSGSGAKHPQIDIDTRPRSSRSEQRRLYHEFAEFKHDTVKEIMRLNDCIERQNDLVHKLLHIVDTSGGGNAKVVADASSAVRTNLMSSLVFSLIEQQKHQLQQQLHQQQKHQHEPRSLPSPSTAMDLLQRMRDSI